jgi:pimeloyl-[acyl-carrier protein] methyl ester esterase
MTLHRESLGAGAGLPLVCLHGWGLNLRVFDALRRQLASEREVIGIDLPGHGASPWNAERGSFAAQAQWLLEQLPPRCVLLGWSLGGQLSLQIAHQAQARIAQLVLVATTPRFAAGADWNAGMAAPLLQRFATQLAQDWQATVRDFLQLQVRGSRDADVALVLLERALHEHGQASPHALAAGLDILRDIDLRAQLPELAIDTLVISGQHDRITPPAAAAYLAATLPSARLVQLPRAGHAPFLSHSDEFTQLLREFLEAA